jgi:hypothetical protein
VSGNYRFTQAAAHPQAKLRSFDFSKSLISLTRNQTQNGNTYRQTFCCCDRRIERHRLRLAKQFAQNGFDLMVVSEGDGIQDAAARLQSLGAQVETVNANLAEHDGTHKLLQAIQAGGRQVDAIALNAGVGVSGPFVETDLSVEMNMIRLNVLSVVHVAKYVIRDMVARGSGRVLITSSIAGTMPTRRIRWLQRPTLVCRRPGLQTRSKGELQCGDETSCEVLRSEAGP